MSVIVPVARVLGGSQGVRVMRNRTGHLSLFVVASRLAVLAASAAGACGTAAQDRRYVCESNVVASFGEGRYTSIEVRGSVAYCIYDFQQAKNVQVFDVSSPLGAELVSTIDVAAETIVFDQGRLYALTETGFEVYDIADPSSPVFQGALDVEMYGFAAEGDRVYITNRDVIQNEALQIYDVSDPSSIQLLGEYTPNFDFVSYLVDAVGDLVVLGTPRSEYPMHVIDVSNPAAPVSLGVIDSDTKRREFVLDGSILYASYAGFVDSYNLAGGVPEFIARIETDDLSPSIGVFDDFLCVADYLRLEFWDVSNPLEPALAGAFEAQEWIDVCDVAGDRAVVDVVNTGIGVLDLSALPEISLIRMDDALYRARSVGLLGGYITASDGDGMMLIDPLLDPQFPLLSVSKEVASFGDVYLDAELVNGYLYIRNVQGSDGLTVVDVSDPNEPVYVSGLAGDFADFRHDDDLLVARYNTSRLSEGFFNLCDVSNPANPVMIDKLETGRIRAFDIDNDVLAVSTGNHVPYQLELYDVSDASAPVLAGSYQHEDGIYFVVHVAVGNGFVYALFSDDTLGVLDVSDPSAPVVVSAGTTFEMPIESDSVNSFEVIGETIYVVDGFELYLVDIADPSAPALLSRYEVEGSIAGLDISADKVWIADEVYGLELLDVSDPTMPERITLRTFPAVDSVSNFMAVQFDATHNVAYLLSDSHLLAVDVSTPCERECAADVNGDGKVTVDDLNFWVDAFNNNSPECDQNGDGDCTPTDFTAWITNFNLGCD